MTLPELHHGRLRLRLHPAAGGSVAGFWIEQAGGEFALLRPMPEGADDALSAGQFPMVPFANCIRDNRFSHGGRDWQVAPNMADSALNFHGSGWRLPWTVAAQDERQATLALTAQDGVWSYRAEQCLALRDDGLSVTLTVTNLGEVAMPFGLGLHPWFPRHGNALVRFASDRVIFTEPAGEALAPVPLTPDTDHARAMALPHAYVNRCHSGWDGIARILWPDHGLGLTLTADPVLGQLMVHVPADDPGTFCLEPQSNPPCAFDAFDRGDAPVGLPILAPGASLTARMTLRIDEIPPENPDP